MKNLHIILSTAFLLLAGTLAAYAQQVTVKGTVKDESGLPLPGAAVLVKHVPGGTVTDDKGEYTIKASPNNIIQVQYIGYVTAEEKVGNRGTVDFVLKEDNNMLDDVVVIGYGSVKKHDLTGSVATVTVSDIKDAPAYSIDNALQGRIAGADIMSTSGAPGATTTIRIRGTRSINASNEPLIVVDGVMDAIHDLNDINTDDVASISVLKDASATAIYGSRGSNGVIIITTKVGQGVKDKVNITFKADGGFSQLPRTLDIMNATEFAIYRNELASFGSDANHSDVGMTSPLSEQVYADPLKYGEGTDWIKEVTRTAPYQNYALSVSGRDDKHNYYISLSYNDTEGIIKNSGQQRFTGRVKFERQFFKWLNASYSGSYTWRRNDETLTSIGGTAYYSAAQYLSPFLKPTDTINTLYSTSGGTKYNSPSILLASNTYNQMRHSTNHALAVDITPINNLHIKSIFSFYLYQRHTYRYYPSTLPASMDKGGQAYRAEYDDTSFNSETTVSYNLKKGKHTFTPLVGFSAYSLKSNSFGLSGSGYQDDAVMWNNMNAVMDKETYSASTSYSAKQKMSAFARADYNYNSRYYLTVTGRFDAASNFAANRKWAFFPSAAFRWNMSQEPWLKDVKWIDDLSIRLSAGRTGNDSISAYQSMSILSSTTGGYLFEGSQPAAFYRSRLDSPDLTWEKTDLYNLALDLSLFDQRLNITAEAYTSRTTDLLLSVQLPTQSGYSSRLSNLGTTTNKGVELTINTMNIIKKHFTWSTAFTISHNSQMVEDIGTSEFVATYNSPGNNPYMMYGYVAGYPLNSLWGFKYAGTWKSTDEVERNKVTKTYACTSNTLGGPRYYDVNHDGSLNQLDLVYQGNADPVIFGGLQNTFHIYGFKLGVFLNYSLGGKIYNISEIYMAGSTFSNQYRYMLNAWHPTRNPNSNIPRAGGKTDAALPSDFMIHDASYFRIKNVSLGYTFDFSKKRLPIRDITLTASGENLYLWKNYNGFDPDVSSEGTSSTLRRVDNGAYPKARTIIFSIQVRY